MFKSKTKKQTIEEYFDQLMTDCVTLHAKAKDMIKLTDEESGKYLEWYMTFSDEPQYQILRIISLHGLYPPEEQHDNLLKLGGLLDECRSYNKKLEAQTMHDRWVRCVAEWGWYNNNSVRQIVDQLVKLKLVDDIDRDNATRNVYRYLKSFPSFVRKQEMNKKIDLERLQRDLEKTQLK